MGEDEKTFYVGLDNPSGLRRQILSCSKDIVSVLKNYDKINSIRKAKIEKIIELQKIISEIKKLNSILKERLPSEKVRAKSPKAKKDIIKKKVIKNIQVRNVVKSQDSEISKLEGELSEIEERLNKLGV